MMMFDGSSGRDAMNEERLSQSELYAGGRLLTILEIAKRFGVADRTVRVWIGQGRLRGQQIGRRWYFETAEVDRFEKARRR